MHFITLVLTSLASLALGQVTSTSSAVRSTQTSTCAAQNVLDACVSSTKAQLNACMQTDYDCLCNAYGVVLVCYNNCPSDAGAFAVQQSRDQYCIAASAYGTKTASKSITATVSSSTVATTTTTRSGTSTSSTTLAAATHNAAAGIHVGSGMVVIVALAGLGLLA